MRSDVPERLEAQRKSTVPLTPCRVLRKVPEAIESFQDRAVTLLKDRHHAVMLGGVTLMLEMCAIDPALIPVYQPQVPVLCKMLRSMLTSGFLPEYDVGGITNPFLQVKVPPPPFPSPPLGRFFVEFQAIEGLLERRWVSILQGGSQPCQPRGGGGTSRSPFRSSFCGRTHHEACHNRTPALCDLPCMAIELSRCMLRKTQGMLYSEMSIRA